MSRLKTIFPLLLIICLSFVFRLIGLNWDQNSHLHPDERFLTMVTLDITWPKKITNYFDTKTSPLNPHNHNHNFYVYGLWPVLLVKAIAQIAHLHDYANLNLVGRVISAFVDVFVVIFVYKISLHISKKRETALISSFVYTCLILPIQLAHFFTTDPYLNLMLAICLYTLVVFIDKPNPKFTSIFTGLSIGMAISAKISAILFTPIIALAFLIHLLRHKKISVLIPAGILLILTLFISVHLFYPYLFSDFFQLNPLLLANWKQLKGLDVPSPYFPPSLQWAHTPKWLFSFLNIVFIGVGPIWTLIAVLGLLKVKLQKKPGIFLTTTWIVLLFVFQGAQIVKPLRYLLPIFPGVAVLMGSFLTNFSKKIIIICLGLGAFWSLSFLSIYLHPHTRVAASQWIYDNIPAGSKLSCDLWDDCLPLLNQGYQLVETHPYDPDWSQYQKSLDQVDYLVISSNRTYGAIIQGSNFYPQTSDFYKQLFAGQTKFKKIAEFTSRPHIFVPGISYCLTPFGLNYGSIAGVDCGPDGLWLVDDVVDESLTVYDHPKVIIFKRL